MSEGMEKKVYRILALNFGSTSSKLACFENDVCRAASTLSHPAKELEQFPTFWAQEEYRLNAVAGFLQQNGIRPSDMDAFVALTSLDETNIILAMYASQMNSCKVVAKINRNSFAELATAKGMVDSVVSTASVTSEAIAMYVRAMQNSFESENIKTLHSLVGGRVEALEFNVAPGLPFIGVPLKDLILRKGLLVAGIVRRNGQPVIPSGNDALQEGDDVVIVTTDTTLHSLRDIVVK